jgi:hypothetical protein
MARGASVLLVLTAVSCGRISPGVISRPGPNVSAPSSGSNSGTSSGGYKSIYDDKGCVNGIGESGAAQQAKCRSGK